MATPTTLPAAFVSGAILTADQMNNLRGAFRVLQVVEGSTSTEATNATNVFADTNLTATITPSSTTSKVLVLVNQLGVYKTAANAENRVEVAILRGATQIASGGSLHLYTATAIIQIGNCSMSILDSPATTSATTYKTQFRNPNNTAQAQVQAGSARSSIILMEISA